MITLVKAKVKNNSNSSNADIFYFFLKYQQAKEQREEQGRRIAHV